MENDSVTDYHNFCHRGSSKAHRKKLNIGSIYVNAAECLDCGWFIRSRNRHDYVTCQCGNISVDGGSLYAKRTFRQGAKWKDIIELFKGESRKKAFN